MDLGVSILATLTLIGGIMSALVLLVLFYELLTKRRTAVLRWIGRHGLWLMFIVTVIATFGSLFLSEIVGWTPCKDCWLQRIFMYPQAVLLLIALLKRDRGIAVYILILALIGSIISIDHYYDQIMATFFPDPVDPNVPCDTTGVSCSRTYTFRYGYITVPMMALTAFVMSILGSIAMLRRRD